MGWNDVRPVAKSRLFDQLDSGARFYFLHSYYFDCARDEDQLAVADYGSEFACAVHADHIFGVQFHPEKSHHYGARLLQNFAEM
jgi:glutamine amidotransferase